MRVNTCVLPPRPQTTCGSAADSYDRTGLSHRLFRHFLGPAALPYSAIQLGRYKLIFLNGVWLVATAMAGRGSMCLGIVLA